MIMVMEHVYDIHFRFDEEKTIDPTNTPAHSGYEHGLPYSIQYVLIRFSLLFEYLIELFRNCDKIFVFLYNLPLQS